MRIGVIGAKWGLMHVGALRAAGAEVVALCGEHLASTREIAAREGIPLAGSAHPGRAVGAARRWRAARDS
jgi:predicted dehydrogenase